MQGLGEVSPDHVHVFLSHPTDNSRFGKSRSFVGREVLLLLLLCCLLLPL